MRVKCPIVLLVLIGLLLVTVSVVLVTGNTSAGIDKFKYRALATEIAMQRIAEGKVPVVRALIRPVDTDSRQFEVRGSVSELDRLAANPAIVSVATEFDLQPNLKQGLVLIGADQIRSVYNGRGGRHRVD